MRFSGGVLQQLSQLHTQLATVQHHLTELTLAVLHEQTGLDQDLLHQRLPAREGKVLSPPRVGGGILASASTSTNLSPVARGEKY